MVFGYPPYNNTALQSWGVGALSTMPWRWWKRGESIGMFVLWSQERLQPPAVLWHDQGTVEWLGMVLAFCLAWISCWDTGGKKPFISIHIHSFIVFHCISLYFSSKLSKLWQSGAQNRPAHRLQFAKSSLRTPARTTVDSLGPEVSSRMPTRRNKFVPLVCPTTAVPAWSAWLAAKSFQW